MKKLVMLAALAAGLLAVNAAAGAGPGRPTLTMQFLEVQTNFSGTNAGEPKPGDRFWFHSEFYKWNGGKRGARLGHADTTATVLQGGVVLVDGVGTLPGGTVSVAGLAGTRGAFTLAVVGGTGAYATARGEVIIRGIGGVNSNTSADTLRIWN
ncbi:MAG: hypothetical protein ACXVRS_08790 [Gaiellaceae bacterium]